MPAVAEAWTEARVVGLLEGRYPPPEWALVTGLRSHVGYSTPGRESYLDAFAMCCYPSKGLTRLAFEIKVSRSDWLAELRDPGKRNNGMAVSNEFWFVAPAGVVKPDEVPEGCGYMQVNSSGLRTRKAAKYREAEPLTMEFTASLLRTITKPDRLKLFQARAFRYAGQDLTADEFLEATAKDVEFAVETRSRGRLKQAVRATPEYALGEAVREAMGSPSWRRPTVADFRAWVASISMGGCPPNGEMARAAGALAGRMENLATAARGLEKKLGGTDG